MIYQNSQPPPLSAPKDDWKFEILLVKIFNLKLPGAIKKTNFVSSRKQPVSSDYNF